MTMYDAFHAFLTASSARADRRPYIPEELANEWCVLIGVYVGEKMDREEEATLP